MSSSTAGLSGVWRNRALAPLAVSTFAAGLVFYVPISTLFLMSRGLSLSDVFVLESVLLISILLTEVPAGAVADRFDRKWMIIAGFALNAIAEIFFAFGTNFAAFVISFAISGVSIAMLTGIQDAYIYDALDKDADKLSVGVFGHFSSIGLAAGVIGSVLGGLMATIDLAVPAITAAAAGTIAACVAFCLPKQKAAAEGDVVDPKETAVQAVVAAARLLVRSPLLLYVAVAASAAYVIFNAVFLLNQPIFAALGIPVAIWGVLGGAAQLVAALYNHFAGKIEGVLGRKYGLLLAMSYGVFGFVLMAIPNSVCAVLGFFLVVLGMFARGPIAGAIANKEIPEKRRATVLNVASTAGSLVAVGVNPLIGFGADANPQLTLVFLAGGLLIFTLTWIPIAGRYLDGAVSEVPGA